MAISSTIERDLERERRERAPLPERRWLSVLNPRPASLGAVSARLVLGVVMLAHGLQKLGLFGGFGWTGTIEYFHAHLGIPPAIGALAILTELVGGALLVIGLAARPAALAVGIEMIVAAFMVHVPNGFFLNWNLVPGVGHGIEMNLALVGLALVVLFEGPGRWSLDSQLADTLDQRDVATREGVARAPRI
jgi:putative oxidoreductase